MVASYPAFPTPRFNWGRKAARVSHVIRAADVTRLFVHRSNMSLGGIYMVTSLFYYLPVVLPRMRERTVLRTYEGGDEVNFISDACFLLDYSYRPCPQLSALCVWLGVSFHLLPVVVRKKVSSCRLSGLIGFMTHLQLEFLPQINAWTVDSFSGIYVIDVINYSD